LLAGFLISLGALRASAVLSEGETSRLVATVLLRINSTSPAWLDLPMCLVTALGYPWLVVLLLLAAAHPFSTVGA